MLLVHDVRSTKTRVALSATDSLRLAGLVHHLEQNRQFEVLSDHEEGAADVFVIAAGAFNPSAMTLMRRASSCSDSPLVLVIDDITVSQLAAAVKYHVVAVLPISITTSDRLQRCVLTAASRPPTSRPQMFDLLATIARRDIGVEAVFTIGGRVTAMSADQDIECRVQQ